MKIFLRTKMSFLIILILLIPFLKGQQVNRFKSNVVSIRNLVNGGPGKVGFGFITKQDYNNLYIMSAGHLVEEKSDTLEIKFLNGETRLGFVVELYAPEVDLVLLKCKRPHQLSWTTKCLSSSLPKSNQKVGYIGRHMEWFVLKDLGRINEIENDKIISLDLDISAGTSGAPLLDDKGKIVGIIVESTEGNAAYALELSWLKNIVTKNETTDQYFGLEEINKGKIREKFMVGTGVGGSLAIVIAGIVDRSYANKLFKDYEDNPLEFDFRNVRPEFSDRAEAYQVVLDKDKSSRNKLILGGSLTLLASAGLGYLFYYSGKKKEHNRINLSTFSDGQFSGIQIQHKF